MAAAIRDNVTVSEINRLFIHEYKINRKTFCLPFAIIYNLNK